MGTEYELLKAEYKQLLEEKEQLENKVSQLEEEADNMVEKINDLSVSNNDLAEEIERLSEENDDLCRDIDRIEWERLDKVELIENLFEGMDLNNLDTRMKIESFVQHCKDMPSWMFDQMIESHSEALILKKK